MFGFLKVVLKNWSTSPCYHLKVFKVKGNIKPKIDLNKFNGYRKMYLQCEKEQIASQTLFSAPSCV